MVLLLVGGWYMVCVLSKVGGGAQAIDIDMNAWLGLAGCGGCDWLAASSCPTRHMKTQRYEKRLYFGMMIIAFIQTSCCLETYA